jgi:four helix bundle protein
MWGGWLATAHLETAPSQHTMDYKQLLAWQAAMDLCETTYRLTDSFPRREVFGLTAQLRKSAVSIPSNIAEGEGRFSWGERRQFLGHARGSLFELDTQFIIAGRVGYLHPNLISDQIDEVRRILNGYITWVRKH